MAENLFKTVVTSDYGGGKGPGGGTGPKKMSKPLGGAGATMIPQTPPASGTREGSARPLFWIIGVILLSTIVGRLAFENGW